MPVLNFPYKTFPELYPYNPYEIKHMSNNQPKMYKLCDRHILQMLSGIGYSFAHPMQNLVLENDTAQYSWLVKNLPIKTRIALLKTNNNRVRIAFPEMQFGYDAVYDGVYNIDKCEFFMDLHSSPFNVSKKDQYIQLSQISEVVDFQKSLLILDNDELIHAFSAGDHRRILEDMCRWCEGNSCPAITLNRIFVDGNGNIRSCKHGKILSTYQEDYNIHSVLESMQQIKNTEYLKRGCYKCDIYETCPKCLFIHNIDMDSYCRKMKDKEFKKLIKKIRKIQLMEYFFYTVLVNV